MPDDSVAQIPVKFDLLPSGDAATGASVVQESLRTDPGSGVYASLVTVVSATSGNAARATTRELRELKHREPRGLRGLSDVALKAAPGKLRRATKAWLAMSEGHREVAESSQGLVELGCTGHSAGLTIEGTNQEPPEANVVREKRAAAVLRAIREAEEGPGGHRGCAQATAGVLFEDRCVAQVAEQRGGAHRSALRGRRDELEGP